MSLLPSLLHSLPHLACVGGEVEEEEEDEEDEEGEDEDKDEDEEEGEDEEEEEEEAEVSDKLMNERRSSSFPPSRPPYPGSLE